MGFKLQGAPERKRSSKVSREVEVEERGEEEVETALHNMKKARRQGQIGCG